MADNSELEERPEETSDTELLLKNEFIGEDCVEEKDTLALVEREKEEEGPEQSRCEPKPESKFRLYRWRWFMLATLFLLNVSNGIVSLPTNHSITVFPSVLGYWVKFSQLDVKS